MIFQAKPYRDLAELKRLADANANRDGEGIVTILLPVGDDIRRRPDRCRIVNALIYKVLKVGQVDGIAIAVSGIVPIVLHQATDFPRFTHINTQA